MRETYNVNLGAQNSLRQVYCRINLLTAAQSGSRQLNQLDQYVLKQGRILLENEALEKGQRKYQGQGAQMNDKAVKRILNLGLALAGDDSGKADGRHRAQRNLKVRISRHLVTHLFPKYWSLVLRVEHEDSNWGEALCFQPLPYT